MPINKNRHAQRKSIFDIFRIKALFFETIRYYIVISRTLLGVMFSISCFQRKNLCVVWKRICFVIKLSFWTESIFVRTIRIARIKRISIKFIFESFL